MRVVFRVDSSFMIGTGHVMRCLTLAHAFSRHGWQVGFICRDLPGNINYLIGSQKFNVYSLPAAHPRIAKEGYAQWLGVETVVDCSQTKEILNQLDPFDVIIVDHYAIDSLWESEIKKCVERIVCIDDLANRSHVCDILIDQNLYLDANTRYIGLVPDQCDILLGPAYALIRPEFAEARKNKIRVRDSLHRLLVFFGGVDASNETFKALTGLLSDRQRDVEIDVIIGIANPNALQIEELCANNYNIHCYRHVEQLSSLMLQADLAIGAGGGTSWERCCLGLPSIIAVLAENQEKLTQDLASLGAVVNLGRSDLLIGDDYLKSVLGINEQLLVQMSQVGMSLVDGLGCERVINKIIA